MNSPGPATGLKDTPLFDLVFQRISESPAGAVPFSEWMELALYHPEHGYYCRVPQGGGFPAIGRRGDFYTSVSVGETFGLLLAHRIVAVWEAEFDPAMPFVVVEQGGHDGRLARDIVAGLEEIGSPLLEQFEYRIVEPRESVRCRLERELGPEREDRIRVVDSLGEARTPQGVFLCNELLDAFPVDLLIYESGEWRERWVGWCAEESRPTWVSRPLRGEWAEWTASELAGDYPEGYRTEVCPQVDVWMEEAAALFQRGLWWIVDYGYERADYYLPQRTTGTLRTYREHRAGEDVLADPGGQDLTAHVDFTRLERAGVRNGLACRRFTDQHHFLIEAARPWLLSLEGRVPDGAARKRLRQFQTLSHPSLMGQQFKVMEFVR